MSDVWALKGDILDIDLGLDAPILDLVYLDPPFASQADYGEFNDKWDSMDNYLEFLLPRIERCYLSLKYGGNLLVHVDWRASHYIKVELDKHIGYDNFHNEIIWQYNSGGASKRHLSRKHDTILWWSKGPDYTFNVLREPYATPDVEGRAGFNPEGRMLTDVWQISFLSTTSKERTGYPTQKPLALMIRILDIFSNPGDLVLDGFCGSGTTGVAAHLTNRDCIMVDANPKAVQISQSRLDKLTDGT